jgi:hypothetical protein
VKVRLTNTREIAMISDDARIRYECIRNAFRICVPVIVERNWNANGTQMEREWNAFRNAFRTRSGRVPNTFSVRLFLSSTVVTPFCDKKRLTALTNKLLLTGHHMIIRIYYEHVHFMVIFIIIINRIFIQDINHFSPKRTVINASPVKYCT